MAKCISTQHGLPTPTRAAAARIANIYISHAFSLGLRQARRQALVREKQLPTVKQGLRLQAGDGLFTPATMIEVGWEGWQRKVFVMMFFFFRTN